MLLLVMFLTCAASEQEESGVESGVEMSSSSLSHSHPHALSNKDKDSKASKQPFTFHSSHTNRQHCGRLLAEFSKLQGSLTRLFHACSLNFLLFFQKSFPACFYAACKKFKQIRELDCFTAFMLFENIRFFFQ